MKSQATADTERRAAVVDAFQEGEVIALARRAARAGTWDLDIKAKTVRYCPRSLEMLGHRADRSPVLTPAEWAEHIFPGDAERVLAEGASTSTEGSDFVTEYRIVTPGGGIRWIRGMGRTLLNEKGEAVRCVGFNFDITEEKKAEAAFRRMQADLAKSSRANAMAAMAESLAHEVNQPLTAISCYLSGARALLGDLPVEDTDQICEAFDRAVEAAQRTAAIIRNLRALTRGKTGDGGFASAEHVVAKALELALIGTEDRGISVDIDMAPDLRADIDEAQFRQVLYNLLRNAVEAVEEADIRRLRISAREEDRCVVVRIEDSGAGLSHSDLDRMFEPFVSTKHNGVGIGLSIARTIAEAQGGHLRAERLEAGAAFVLRLPVACPQGTGQRAAG